MKECIICGNEASETDRNQVGYLCCQMCGDPLCYTCAVYGFDLLPRCEKCHSKHTNKCYDECKGNINNSHCERCEYFPP